MKTVFLIMGWIFAVVLWIGLAICQTANDRLKDEHQAYVVARDAEQQAYTTRRDAEQQADAELITAYGNIIDVMYSNAVAGAAEIVRIADR